LKLSDWREKRGWLLETGLGPTLPPERWMVVGLMALAALLRLFALDAESLWFDETYSVAFASTDLSWLSVLRPGGVPFAEKNVYNVFMHFWLALGQTDFMIRLPSALFGVATVGVVFLVARRLFGRHTALWGAVLVAVAPFQIWYSQEARMYALAALFAWLSVWAALKGLDGGRRWPWLLYLVSAALGLYTHSFTGFLLLALNLWIVLTFLLDASRRRSFVPWLAANLIVLGLAVPWLAGTLQQRDLGWWDWVESKYGAPGLEQLLRLVSNFALGTVRPDWDWQAWIALASWGIALLLGLIPPAREDGRSWWLSGGQQWTLAVILAAVPVLTVFALSQFVPMFVLRYTFAFMPAFALLAGRGLARLRRPLVRWGVILPYFAGVALILAQVYFVPQKEDWRGAAAYLTENAPPGAAIFLVDEDIRVPVEHYYKQPAEFIQIWRGEVTDAELSRKIDPVRKRTDEAWLVVSHTDNDAVEQYMLHFADIVEKREFTGVSVFYFHWLGGGG